MKNKLKLKAKGKKYYKNTHGKIYRVKSNYKIRKQNLLRKRQKRENVQLAVA